MTSNVSYPLEHPLRKDPVISNYKISFHTHKPLRSIISKLLEEIDKREKTFTVSLGPISAETRPSPTDDSSENTVKSVKLLHNFAVVRTDRYVYTLNDSGFVNITKLRTLADADEAVRELREFAHLPATEVYNFKIDNVTASGRLGYSKIPLHKLAAFVTTNACFQVAKCTYRPNYFSGASLKYHGGGGTAILFTTGAFTIVGAKCESQVSHVYKHTQRLVVSLLQAGETCLR